jgi:hypothetical protein
VSPVNPTTAEKTKAQLRDRLAELNAPEAPADATHADLESLVADATVAPAMDRPLLGSGCAGADVYDLAQRLGKLGYGNSIASGENAFNILDTSVLSAVNRFRADHDVPNDTDVDPGTHVGVQCWAALIRAGDAS